MCCPGGMLVVSVSVCGLVTLAAMTQPSLAPEAKHSLLQYVTGKYLHPSSCRVSIVLVAVCVVLKKCSVLSVVADRLPRNVTCRPKWLYGGVLMNVFSWVQVEWGWQEPQPVGETMCFTVHCFQRNGQPYPVCDTDNLEVTISHGTRKVRSYHF